MAKTPGLNLVTGIDPVNPVPVDANYGPYANVAAAKAAIPPSLRYDGLTVQITGSGNYWWIASDLSDDGLVPKANINKVGTPVNNQIAIWFSDKEVEGSSDLTYDPATGLAIKKDLTLGGLGSAGRIRLDDGTGGVVIDIDVSPGEMTIAVDTLLTNDGPLVSESNMQAELSAFSRLVPVSYIGTPSPGASPIINSVHPTLAGSYYFEWSRTTDNRLLNENGLAYLSENGTILELI